jgi:hypothetical protein
MVSLSISSEKVALTLAVGAASVAFVLGTVLVTFGEVLGVARKALSCPFIRPAPTIWPEALIAVA